jgi:phosphohistidine swiveling domain-containing protein
MQKEYFGKHLSLSDWTIQTNLSNKESIIQEDATKRKRLNVLNDIIELPIIKTYQFTYEEIIKSSDSFESFLEIAGEKKYALRAHPKEKGLPILRNRKLKVSELLSWLMNEKIEFKNYEYCFELHIEPEIATIFIVEDNRIIGELASGSILQLNKGIHDDENSIYFEYDFQNWKLSSETNEVKLFLQNVVDFIFLKEKNKQSLYENKFLESMDSVYLKGYFEVISSSENGIIYIDYNRSLKDNLNDVKLFRQTTTLNERIIKGNVGCSGKATGKAKVILEEEIDNATISNDEILVCHFTSPEFLPLITSSAAVVTDIGGILSHAAIVCRELKKPCVIGTKVGTKQIKTGDLIEVDAIEGCIRFY